MLRRPAGSNAGKPARIERTRPSTEDLSRLAKEAREQGTWGEKDMHRPRNDRERMRKGTPYSQSVEVVFGCRETDCVSSPRSSRIQDGPEQRVLIRGVTLLSVYHVASEERSVERMITATVYTIIPRTKVMSSLPSVRIKPCERRLSDVHRVGVKH